MELVPLELAAVAGGEVLQVEVDLFPSSYLDGPVAPQGWVGAQVVRRKELAGVSPQ